MRCVVCKVSVSCLLSGPRAVDRAFSLRLLFFGVILSEETYRLRDPCKTIVCARTLAVRDIDKTRTSSAPVPVSLFVAARSRYRVALVLRDNACAVTWLETRALRRWMQKSQDGDPFAVHTLRGRKCVANDAMRSTTAAHDAKRIGCATRTEKCSRGRGASALLARTGRRRRDACQAPSPRQRPTPSPR